ncbi:hypothetical protein AtNW77_Chr1g0000491 [Arabidopsis thaliana]
MAMVGLVYNDECLLSLFTPLAYNVIFDKSVGIKIIITYLSPKKKKNHSFIHLKLEWGLFGHITINDIIKASEDGCDGVGGGGDIEIDERQSQSSEPRHVSSPRRSRCSLFLLRLGKLRVRGMSRV